MMNARGGEIGTWPVPYSLPLLDNHVGELDLFKPVIQERLLRISTELKLFNEQVAYLRHLVDRSFSGLSSANYSLNESNLRIANRNVGVRCEMLVRAID